MKEYEKISPFKWQLLQSFPFIAEDFDQLTEYALYCKLVEYMNKVIDGTNLLGENVDEYIAKFNALKEYVDNYFENLDVQDEIDNKLNAMAQDGTLDEIINQEIFGEIISNIGDLNKLNTIDKSSIVNSINNTDTNQTLYLGLSIVYDILEDDIGHIQGACTNNDTLYVGVQGGTGYSNGTIYVFNIVNNTYVGKYENIPFYHVNDMTYLNNKLYIIEYDTKNIGVYDIANGTYSTIPVLSSINQTLVGIEKVGEKLLVWTSEYPNNFYSIDNEKFYLINPTALTIDKVYTINNPYKLLNFTNINGIVVQSFSIKDNNLFLLFQQPNVILKCIFEENTIKPLKFYNLPMYDNQGNPLGESEGIALIDNNYYPQGSFILVCRNLIYTKNYQVYGHDHLKCYIVNPFTNTVMYSDMAYGYYQRSYNRHEANSVSKTAINNSLIEVGSSGYPFKELIRGINSTNYQDHQKLYIRDSSSYYLPYLSNYDNINIYVSDNNIHPTIYLGDIDNCNISIYVSSNSSDIKIKSLNDNHRITFLNSKINLVGDNNNTIIFEDCQLLLKGTEMLTRRCKFNNTSHMSSGFAIQVFDGSIFTDGFNDINLHEDDKLVMTGGSGVGFVVDLPSHTYTKQTYSNVSLLT